MKRFKNILFVYTGDAPANEQAMAQAMRLADANGADLTILTVLQDYPSDWQFQVPLKRYLKEQVIEDVNRITAASGEARREQLEIEFADGITFIEVIGRVLAREHDLVIKAAEPKPGKSTSWLGFHTPDMHLFRKCPCPIWLFKKPRPEQPEGMRILVPVDPKEGEQDLSKGGLTRTLLELGTSLREMLNASATVINCWELEGEDALRHSPFLRVSDDEIEQMLGQTKAARQAAFEKAIASFRLAPNTDFDLVKGNPTSTIPSAVHEGRVDIVVMGTVARTGIRGLLIGNTAEAILNQVDCSVLAVKPSEFVTPVAPSSL